MSDEDIVFHDFAISFAGESRDLARQVSEGLKERGCTVFYDNDYRDKLLGQNLFTYLRTVYGYRCRFVICLISPAYSDREWTCLEKNAIQERMLKSRFSDDFLLPILVDGAEPLEDIPQTIGYLQVSSRDSESVRQLIDTLAKKNMESESRDVDVHSLTGHLVENIYHVIRNTHLDCRLRDDEKDPALRFGSSGPQLRFVRGYYGLCQCIQIFADKDDVESSRTSDFPDWVVVWTVSTSMALEFELYDFATPTERKKTPLGFKQLVNAICSRIEQRIER